LLAGVRAVRQALWQQQVLVFGLQQKSRRFKIDFN